MTKVKIIAEIANAHQGKPELALELAKASIQSGADAIKFQIYFAQEFLTKSHARYDHFKKQAFSHEDWNHIFTELKDEKVEIYADVFGLEALDLAIRHDLDGIKIHSSDLNNTQVLNGLASQSKKVFLSTGGSTVLEIEYALNVLEASSTIPEIVLLHGFQAYPTKVEDSVISRIIKLRSLFPSKKIKLGYMDHISGDDKFATILPLMCLPYGVDYIEKHVTLDRAAKGVDYYSSYEPSELKQFILDLRLAETSIGENPLSFSESEKTYRNGVKKSWVVNSEMMKGSVIKPSDIVMKRTPDFFAPPLYEEIIGSKLNANLKIEEAISNSHFKHKVLAIVVARSDSSRLSNKASKLINEEATLTHLFERLKLSQEKGFIDTIAFCTTTESSDDKLISLAKDFDMKVYRGPVEDVLARMMIAIDDNSDHDLTLRVTGDDILIDPEYLDYTVQWHLDKNAHYTDAKCLPSGTEVEVFNSSTLKLIHELSKDTSGSEYLTNYIKDNADQFETASIEVKERHQKNYRLTLDTSYDFEVIKSLLEYLSSIDKKYTYNMDDIVDYFEANPDVLKINTSIKQKAAPISVNTEINWKYFTKRPKVSVYITNYNYGKYLKQAIDSVLNQKFRDFEVLVIDDGSVDNSKEVLSLYANHPKVTIVYQKNKGLNVTNNIAIKLSKGDYIVRLDADDYLNDNALLLMADKLNRDPDLALVFPDYYLVDEEGELMSEEKRHDFNSVTMMDQPAHGACTMIRKDILIELGGYSEEFSRQDGYELWIKIIKDKKVANIDLPLFYYRQHGKSLTNDKSKLLSTRHKIVEKHSQEFDVSSKKHLIILPIRDASSEPLALREFADSTLLDICISRILDCSLDMSIVVSTPNSKILQYVDEKYKDKGVITDLRSKELSLPNVPIIDTIDSLLEKYDFDQCETMSVINYEYPLRGGFYIEKAINTMYLFEADAVLSVQKENANFYMHKGAGLDPINNNSELRLEREFIYKEVGGIHSVKSDSYAKNRQLIPERTTHILLDDHASKMVKSKSDFEFLEYVYKKEIS
ncbi:MAG: N-acetylneuraminate synthase family protein [Candidatus Cloacimonetes bacterium]|nr:N-acetylneuraminate synthase family protein [Candidatus Cloacimonadota bacterium]